MKKSLLAVAALGAFASAAQAQSSVTVYGILDVGYIGTNSSANTSNTGSTVANGGTGGANYASVKSTSNVFTQSAESTSRLGFKGTEDMGGGTSAFFTAEFQLYPNDATLSGNTTSGLLNRQTFVGLKKNGVGQAAVGTQYTPIFNALAATDPGQTNNMAGSVIYPKNGNGGGNSDSALTVRTSNTLSLKSDNFGGFTGSAIWVQNAKNTSEQNTGGSNITGGNVNTTGWGLGADFTYSKFYAAAAYQALKQFTTTTSGNVAYSTEGIFNGAQANGATTAPTATALCSAGTNGTTLNGCGLNAQDNQFYAAATYDFGILKAYANYINRKVTATGNTGYYMSRAGQQIGVRSYITPTVEGWASAGLGRYAAYGAGQPTANFNAWQLGTNYYLSKRTNLYAIYGQVNTSNAGYTSYAPTTGNYTGSYNASNYAVGVRHTF